MSDLEKGFNGSESVRSNGVDGKLQGDTGEALKETLITAGGEGTIEQMIGDVDNESVSKILDYYLREKLRTKEEIMKEINVYYNEVLPKLGDQNLNSLFESLVSRKKTLPSSIVKEFKIRDEIMGEPNPKVKELMEISLESGRFPSMVLKGKSIYEKLAKVEKEDEKEIILRYLKNGLSSDGVEDEYVFYTYIRDYGYKNTDLKNFILSLLDSKKADPSLIVHFFDIFKDWENLGDEQKKYIMDLINNYGL